MKSKLTIICRYKKTKLIFNVNFSLDELERPGSRLTLFNYSKNSDLKVDLEKLSLLNDGDSNRVDTLYQNKDHNMEEGGAYAVEPMDEKVRFKKIYKSVVRKKNNEKFVSDGRR